jgi:hypothetical protein
MYRIVFQIPDRNGQATEQEILDAINNSPLRHLAVNWSLTKQNDRPRVNYRSPVAWQHDPDQDL